MWCFICLVLSFCVGIFFIIVIIFSFGNFYVSMVYFFLSFVMYMFCFGVVVFMNWCGGIKIVMGMFWFVVGGVFGWLFVVVFCVLFVVEEIFFVVVSD